VTVVEHLPEVLDLREWHGDTWAESLELTLAGAPLDLTGATVEAWATNFQEELIALTAVITDATGGVVTIAPPAGGLAPGRYVYDVQATTSDSNTRTWVRGHLDIYRDVSLDV
jgi:hypothetical protein